MATITPVAFWTGSTIAGTTQIGKLSIGTSPQDYGVVGANNGITYWATPDQDLGYVIAHDDLSASHTGNTLVGGIQTKVPGQKVGFFRSTLPKDEETFLEFTNTLFNQNFTGGTQAKTWLNNNGYWTSYSDIWNYDSLNNLSWTDDTTGYTLLTGGVTAVDDGYWVNPITIPTFYMNNQTSSNLYISTNAVVTLGVGYDICCPYSPQDSSNPALISGNAGDMFANPGVALTDGTIMNAYYKITQNGDKTKIELKVFQAILSAQNSPYSYQLNLYRDSTYQWVETRIKSNHPLNTVGPYNAIDVSQPSSTTSQVWRGDLLGQNWEYMGTGSITS